MTEQTEHQQGNPWEFSFENEPPEVRAEFIRRAGNNVDLARADWYCRYTRRLKDDEQNDDRPALPEM